MTDLPAFPETGVGSDAEVVLPAPSGSDDALALNALFAAHPAGTKFVAQQGTYRLNSGSLVLRSGHTYDFAQAAFTSQQGMGKALVVNAAQTAVVSAANGAMTSGSPVLTAAAIAGVATAGQTVIVAGAGAGTPAAPLVAQVLSVAGSTVTLDTNASATVAGATVALYNRDSDIVVLGGAFSRTDTAGVANVQDYVVFSFMHVDRLEVIGQKITTTNSSGYGVRLGDCTDFTVERLRLNTNSDGVHVQGRCFRGSIRNLKGYCGDNMVALTGRDFTPAEETSGDIADVHVENIHMEASAPILVLAGSGTTVKRVTIQGVYGTVKAALPVFQSITFGSYPQTTGGTIDDLVLRDIRAVTSSTAMLLQFTSTTFGRLTVEDLHVDTAATGAIIDWNGATADHVDIAGVRIAAAGSSASLLAMSNSGSIASLAISRVRAKFTGGGQSLLQLGSSASVTKCHMTGINADDTVGAQLVYAPSSTTTLGELQLANVCVDGLSWLLDINTTTTLYLANVRMTTARAGVLNLRSAAFLTIFGSAGSASTSTIGTAAGYKLRVNGLFPRLDISKITDPSDGDLAANSNAALACGGGPVVWNTTAAKWKGVYSGVTYP